MSFAQTFLRSNQPGRHAAEVLPMVAAQAEAADRTRTIAPETITALKSSGLMVLSASKELGGLEESVSVIAGELESLAAACASTAWCLWNHLCVFHLFCGALGPAHIDFLSGIAARHEWVCFPAGAGSSLHARVDSEQVILDGVTSFGSGSRYAEWAGCAFLIPDPATGRAGSPPDLRFSVVDLRDHGVKIEPTWDGSGLRASSTDDVRYENVAVPLSRCAPWWAADRAGKLRDPDYDVINHRYREDWVGLSDLWLAAMAVGIAQAALQETVEEVVGRKAIMGRPMTQYAGVHFNLGRAATAVLAAKAAYASGCAEVDERIEAGGIPTEGDYVRQMAISVHALSSCELAMGHLAKVLGGNGLRESHIFERRQRDFRAMPVHINAHEDRVSERLGRLLLGVEPALF